MIDQKDLIRVDVLFPELKKRSKSLITREDSIKLANRVAQALEKESENLVKEQQNFSPSRFLSTSAG